MAFKIVSSSLTERKVLTVDSEGVTVTGSGSLLSGQKRYAFADIDSIMLADDGELVLQMGTHVFSVKANLGDDKHKHTIEELVKAAQTS
jgi:hypothetical protein